MDYKHGFGLSLIVLAGALAAGCNNEPEMEDGIITEDVVDDRNIQTNGDPLLAERGEPARDTAQRGNGRDMAAGRTDNAEVSQAVAIVSPVSGSNVRGTVVFTEQDDGIMIEASLSGLQPGPHGFHVHEFGDCSQDASAAGGHFNPSDRRHGAPDNDPGERHVGDLGNIQANENGVVQLSLTDGVIAFNGGNSILGKAIVVHSGEDDFSTQPDGAAGTPVACGMIQARSELTQTPPGPDPENV